MEASTGTFIFLLNATVHAPTLSLLGLHGNPPGVVAVIVGTLSAVAKAAHEIECFCKGHGASASLTSAVHSGPPL